MGTSIHENDYQPMHEFKLKWRWTDTRWNNLLTEDLLQIKPLQEKKAEEINEQSARITTYIGQPLSPYKEAAKIDCRPADSNNIVREMLQKEITKCHEVLYISWDPKLAVQTETIIFAKYWDDFCYPGSDDVVVWPQSENWVIIYSHDETLIYYQKKI